MKHIIYTGLSLCLLACSKEMDLPGPQLEVRAAAATVKAGEEARFLLQGNAHVITFYSGEILNDYACHEGRTLQLDSLRLSFSTSMNYGTQKDQLAIFASTDFSGEYTADAVKAASWINITSRFKLAASNSNTARSAGEQDITDLAVEGKPLFIACRFIVQPQSQAGTSRLWTVSAFRLNGTTVLGPQTLADHKSAGWRIVQQGMHDPGRGAVVQASQLAFFGNNDQYKDEAIEDWAISRAINTSELDNGPDWGVPIKAISHPPLKEYSYRFMTPGKYKATFVARNVNKDGEREVVKQVDITVTP